MKTHWDPKAKDSLRQIARYINMKFGRKARQEFMQRVRDAENQLKSSPTIGQIDPLFAHRSGTYRSVVNKGLNKMVYCIDNDTIYIVAFWDTRREPGNQARQVH